VRLRGQLAAVALVAIATGIGAAARAHLAAPDFVMLYLLAIAVAAVRLGRGPSLVASALSVLSYDFFFVPPFHTFAVADARHWLTFATMFVVALIISALTLQVRRHEREALERERRTAALYSLSRAIGSAPGAEQAAAAISRHASETFGAGAAVVFDGAAVPSQGATCLPMRAGDQVLGTLVLQPAVSGDPEQRRLAEAFAAQAALGLERARLAEAARAAELRARTEEMRSSLLSAVSHDLRTPLGAITGAATTLRDAEAAIDPAQRAELVDAICVEAARLERLVANLLEMTKLESGALEVKREWVPLEELVGSALNRLEPELEGRPVRLAIPGELPLISADPVLLEQVFFNLLDNATKHTPPGTALEISARAAGGALEVEVSDRGPGLTPGTEARVFEKFFRRARGGAPGAGLGLSICRAVVEAHGGTISAANRDGGGATFRLALPFPAEAPELPPDLRPASEGPAR